MRNMIPNRIATVFSLVTATPLFPTRAPRILFRRLNPFVQSQEPWDSIRHRSYSASRNTTVYTFEDIKLLSLSPSLSRILIDVREPEEFGAGAIPTAINLPLTSAPEALSMPANEFEDRFGFAKPEADKELVFYCRSGVRSSGAAQLALQNGYGKVGEYQGSWLDWAKNTCQDV